MSYPVDREALWEAGLDLAEDLVDAGADKETVAHSVAVFLDRAVPLDVLIPGIPGQIAEEADGPVFERVVQAIIDLFRIDPEKRAERRAKRQARRAKRQQR